MAEKIMLPGWEFVKRLGGGSYGTVYEIQKTIGEVTLKSALKIMSVPRSRDEIQDIYDAGLVRTEEEATTYIQNQITDVVNEFQIMEKLRGNPYIVKCEEFRQVPHEGWPGADILIRMELLTPINRYFVGRVPEENEVIQLGTDICKALEACHEQTPPILHRDIKAANIMLSPEGDFKLGDFGVARFMEGTKSIHTIAGSEDHMAPEVMMGKAYDKTADIYSLGILLYRLLNHNRVPFLPAEGEIKLDVKAEAKQRRLGGEMPPPPIEGSKRLQEAVLKAIRYNPEHRYASAREFRADLEACLVPVVIPVTIEKESELALAEEKDVPAKDGNTDIEDGTVYEKQWGQNGSREEEKKESSLTDSDDKTVYEKAKKKSVTAEKKKVNENTDDSDDKTVYAKAKPLPEKKKKKSPVPFILGAGAVVIVGIGMAVASQSSQNSAPVPTTTVAVQTTKATMPETTTAVETTTEAELVEVPNLVGLNAEEVPAVLEEVGLKIGAISEVEDAEVPIGIVIEQLPEAGVDVEIGTPIGIIRSKGVKPITVLVPALSGMTSDEAEAVLQDAGLVMESVKDYSSSVKKGYVISQSIEAGTEVLEGDTVTITVSLGAKSEPTTAAKKTSSSSSKKKKKKGTTASAIDW